MMKNKQDLSRRDFIRNSVMAGGAVLLSGVLPSHAQTPIFAFNASVCENAVPAVQIPSSTNCTTMLFFVAIFFLFSTFSHPFLPYINTFTVYSLSHALCSVFFSL